MSGGGFDFVNVAWIGAAAPYGLVALVGLVISIVMYSQTNDRRFMFVMSGLATLLFTGLLNIVVPAIVYRVYSPGGNEFMIVQTMMTLVFSLLRATGLGLMLWGALNRDAKPQ